MTLIRYGRLPSLFREFDEYMNHWNAPMVENSMAPAADIIEHDKTVEIRVDMPGVSPEAIDVKLDGNLLTISAHRKNEKKAEEAGWIRQERSWGTFLRTFTLPVGVDILNPEASYRRGVLTVTLSKKEIVQPKALKVKVED